MTGPLAPVIRRQRPIQQLNARRGIDGTVAAVNEFLQLAAGTIAADTDCAPAIMNLRRQLTVSGSQLQFRKQRITGLCFGKLHDSVRVSVARARRGV
jgi:hypothetical protein